MKTKINEWEEFKPNKIIYPNCNKCWQKLMYTKGCSEIYAEINEYRNTDTFNYELNIQINWEVSITGNEIKVKDFPHNKLDFKEFEKVSKKIIKALTKKYDRRRSKTKNSGVKK
jgi:hypothetical protein